MEQSRAELQAEAEVPQMWDKQNAEQHVSDARISLTGLAAGRAHMIGKALPNYGHHLGERILPTT